jgi:FlaA1/EpsC-like NDP-sugar epimerase
MRLTAAQQATLLGRGVRPLLTSDDRRAFAGERCLVTGAGGTVGGELARQLATCGVAKLTLVDQSEHNLFQIERELEESGARVRIEPVLADVTRPSVIRHLFLRTRPTVVFHAAAYKHVIMAERAICAAARVNVFGTWAVRDAAREVDAKFVLISTDKAASPRSVMGATKRLAELVTLAADDRRFRTSVVRFGNLLLSSGSFLTIALERIQAGRPVQITNPDATRYFMTVSEAASLVMKTHRISIGGEIFWLDMGHPLRIGDLAEGLLRLTAQQGYPVVPLEITGLRAGEKLSEQLTTRELVMQPTTHHSIREARQMLQVGSPLEPALAVLRRAVARSDALGALKAIGAAVPEYEPSPEALAGARAEQLYVRMDAPARIA